MAKKQTTTAESVPAAETPAAANGKAKAPAKKATASKEKAAEAPVTADAPAKKTPAATADTAEKQPAAEKATRKPAAKKQDESAPASPSATASKLFGTVVVADGAYFIESGSIPEGRVQLVPAKGKNDLSSRFAECEQKFVTVAGEMGKKKKTDKFDSFTVQNIASHDEIARRAYELSHENPSYVEGNWFRAENELLSL